MNEIDNRLIINNAYEFFRNNIYTSRLPIKGKLIPLEFDNFNIFKDYFKHSNLEQLLNSFEVMAPRHDPISPNEEYNWTNWLVGGPFGEFNYNIFLLLIFIKYQKQLKRMYKDDIKVDVFGNKNYVFWNKNIEWFAAQKYFNFNSNRKLSISKLRKKYPVPEKENEVDYYTIIIEYFRKMSDNIFSFDETETESKNSYPNENNQFSTYEAGISFEKECSKILSNNGWNCRFTPASGDQGADIIADRGPIKMVIQCKNYKNKVGNDAVQQVFSAKSFFKANIAGVVAENGYTSSAKNLAKSTGVLLMNLEDLKKT